MKKSNQKLSTLTQIKNTLFNTVTKLEADTISHERADSISRASQVIVNIEKLELIKKN